MIEIILIVLLILLLAGYVPANPYAQHCPKGFGGILSIVIIVLLIMFLRGYHVEINGP